MLDSVSSGDGDSDIVYCCVVMVDVEWSDWRLRMVTNELVEGMTGYVTYALGLLTEAWFGASVKRYYEKQLSFGLVRNSHSTPTLVTQIVPSLKRVY